MKILLKYQKNCLMKEILECESGACYVKSEENRFTFWILFFGFLLLLLLSLFSLKCLKWKERLIEFQGNKGTLWKRNKTHFSWRFFSFSFSQNRKINWNKENKKVKIPSESFLCFYLIECGFNQNVLMCNFIS